MNGTERTVVGVDPRPFGTHLWGFACLACGFTQRGVLDRLTVQEHADTHVCPAALSTPTEEKQR